MKQCQLWVDSPEFAEWRAFYQLEAEQQTGDKPTPTPDELGAKLRGWAASHQVRPEH